MPTFTWNLDPVLIGLVGGNATHRETAGAIVIPILYAAIVVAILSAIGAFQSKRAGDRSGMIGSLLFAAVALVVGVLSQNWEAFFGIRYYSLLFVVVFLGGYALLNWQVRRGGGSPETAGDFIVYGVIAVLAGARLGHVIFYDFDKVLDDPAWAIRIWDGGLSSHGATMGLVIAMWLFAKRKGVSFLDASDRFSFSAALGATVVRLGNFLNSEIVGRATDQTWGVSFPRTCVQRPNGVTECWGFDKDGTLRHPSQLYEVALGILVFVALIIADRAWKKEKRPRGAMISLFLLLYFMLRFVVEYWKEFQVNDSWESTITMGQLLSIPGILLGVYGLYYAFSHKLPAGWYRLGRQGQHLKDGEEDDSDEDDDESDQDDDDVRKDRDHDADVDEEFGGVSQKRAAKAHERRAQRRQRRKTAPANPSSKKAEPKGDDPTDEDPLDDDVLEGASDSAPPKDSDPVEGEDGGESRRRRRKKRD